MASSAIPISLLSRPIDLSQVSEYGKHQYKRFFELTGNAAIDCYANGASLTELTDLATSARGIINICRCSISPDHRTQDQWQLNRLSEVKEKLAKAIALKKSYYDNHLFGIITKYFLMLFCMWNQGNTADIVPAEDVLLFWDSRCPVMKISHPDNPRFGKYCKRQDFSTSQLDTSRYYNYNPSRPIELENGEKINYASL